MSMSSFSFGFQTQSQPQQQLTPQQQQLLQVLLYSTSNFEKVQELLAFKHGLKHLQLDDGTLLNLEELLVTCRSKLNFPTEILHRYELSISFFILCIHMLEMKTASIQEQFESAASGSVHSTTAGATTTTPGVGAGTSAASIQATGRGFLFDDPVSSLQGNSITGGGKDRDRGLELVNRLREMIMSCPDGRLRVRW